MADKEKNLFDRLSQQLKLSPEQIKSSAAQGDVGSLTKNIDREKANQLNQILSDPEKTKAVLESPQAQALMKLLNKK